MACVLQPDELSDLLYVKKEDVYCGYRKEYLAQNLSMMEEGFVACNKCSGIMREASLSNGEIICLMCIETTDKPTPIKAVQDSIRILRIKCPLLRDCDWMGVLSDAETHLTDCSFILVQCTECKQVLPRRERQDHENTYCPLRTIQCEHCEMGGKAEDKEKHLQFCSEFPISCSKACGAEFPRNELSKHTSECELEVITCPYTEYGCEAKSILRRDIIAHKKEYLVEHTDMSLARIKQLEVESVRMKWKAKTMKQLDGVEWNIRNVDQLKDGEEIEGPTFYVNNYKLRMYCILCNETFQKYFYFFLKRIEGDFDKNLGVAYITHYRMIEVNKQGYSDSKYMEGKMNYQLKIGKKSGKFWSSYLTTDQSLIRFYFDVNCKHLLSLDAEYPTKIPSPPITPDSSIEHDPWYYYID